MRIWTYPIIALVFNYILFQSFHYGEYGGGIAKLLTFPIIALLSFAFTTLHYILHKKSIKTKYFQVIASCLVVLLSYFLFPTANSPISVIRKMRATANAYQNVVINDYFLENRFENFERIVAAKKKFYNIIPDTSFGVNVYRLYEYGNFVENYGIMFHKGKPSSTNENVIIEKIDNRNYKFTENFAENSLTFNANRDQISEVKGRLDSFTVFGTGFRKEPNIKTAETNRVLKTNTPDTEYWAYRIFYWIL
ncbi:MAG: hypothetical protein EOO93_29335 [Pedobacter sp.]|nr:MAG: hypothetical protein EOO93_29335 [Pedobacter sp.]